MMSAHIPLEDLSAHIDGALPPARRDQVDAHLATCEECRREYESLLWTVEFTRSLPRARMPEGASLGVSVPAEPEGARHLQLLWSRPLWAAAAALAIIALGIAALLARSDLPGRTVAMLAGEQRAPLEAREPGAGSLEEGEAAAELAAESLEVPEEENDVGYPGHLATARAAAERERGFFAPPPEMGIYQPTPDATAIAMQRGEAATRMPNYPELPPPPPEMGGAMELPALGEATIDWQDMFDRSATAYAISDAMETEMAGTQQAATAQEIEAAPGAPPGAAERNAAEGGLPVIPLAALAAVLLALSALLYVRAQR
jgi:hypothetical protein